MEKPEGKLIVGRPTNKFKIEVNGFECILILLFPTEENYFTIMVTEFHQAMTVSVRSCDLNDFAGSKVVVTGIPVVAQS